MTRHLAKLLDAIWTLSMGLFLGLTGGMVLSVILTFRGARAIDATPGIEPFNDPMFAEYHNEAVAGYIGQDLFMVGGTVALVLLGVALVARVIHLFVVRLRTSQVTGSKLCHAIQYGAIFGCLIFMCMGAYVTVMMNSIWPNLYSTDISTIGRPQFEQLHRFSERFVGIAWLCGFIALTISPWCRRITDEPSKAKPEDDK